MLARYLTRNVGRRRNLPLLAALQPISAFDCARRRSLVDQSDRVGVDAFVSEDATRYGQLLRSRRLGGESSSRTVMMALTGNAVITALKGIVWIRTGSSAMLAETIHTFVDTLNQGILMVGLRQARLAPDRSHPYGYGKNAFFWSLVSALGLFWCGAGVSIFHGIEGLIYPHAVESSAWETWGVLGASFLIDGFVLVQATQGLLKRAEQRPELAEAIREANTLGKLRLRAAGVIHQVRTTHDPFLPAVFMEDAAATGGVLLAVAGLGMTWYTGSPVYDSIASIAIGGLLAMVATRLVTLNQKFLLGHSVDQHVVDEITRMILDRQAIEGVGEVQTQWLGPNAFSYKAEVDFDGTFLAATLQEEYRPLFTDSPDLRADLPVLLSLFAEDVTRLAEQEVKDVEDTIRRRFPQAAFIELEPDSKDTGRRAASRMAHADHRHIERREVVRALQAILKARRALSPNDPGLETEELRLRRWMRRSEIRERTARALDSLNDPKPHFHINRPYSPARAPLGSRRDELENMNSLLQFRFSQLTKPTPPSKK